MTTVRIAGRRPQRCPHGVLGKSSCRECRREQNKKHERRRRERQEAAQAGKPVEPMQPGRSDRCPDCGGRLEFDTVDGHLVESCPKCAEQARRARLQARIRPTAGASAREGAVTTASTGGTGVIRGEPCPTPLCGGTVFEGRCAACEKRRAAFPPPPPRVRKPKPEKPKSRPCAVCEIPVKRDPKTNRIRKMCPACTVAKARHDVRLRSRRNRGQLRQQRGVA